MLDIPRDLLDQPGRYCASSSCGYCREKGKVSECELPVIGGKQTHPARFKIGSHCSYDLTRIELTALGIRTLSDLAPYLPQKAPQPKHELSVAASQSYEPRTPISRLRIKLRDFLARERANFAASAKEFAQYPRPPTG